MRFPLALVALLLTTAASADTSRIGEDGWTIAVSDHWCLASNRDPDGLPVATYSSGLSFGRPLGSELVYLRVYFWPGAFTDDQEVILAIEAKESGSRMEAPARATGDTMVDLDHALSEDEQHMIADAGEIVVSAWGVEQPLIFHTRGIATALVLLNDCADNFDRQ